MKILRLDVSALRRAQISERALLLLIVLMAFALRLYRLGAPAIWWDESLSVYRATRDLAAILSNVILIQNVVTYDTLPQLYFVLLHFCVNAFGASEFGLRFFSVIASVAAVPLLYALARRWLSILAARVAALLAALSPFYVYYSQEARPYALLLFASLLAVYALTRAFGIERGRYATGATPQTNAEPAKIFGRWLFAYILAAAASLHTHYYALFLFPFHAILIALLISPMRAPRAWLSVLLPAIPLALGAFLIPQITASMAGNANTGPSFVPLDIILRDLLNSFSVGVTADAAQVAFIDAALLALFAIGVVFADSKFRIPNSEFRIPLFLLAYFLIPLLGLYIASYVRPLYQNSRHLIALSPPFYLGVAAGIAALAQRRMLRVLALPALGVFLIGAASSLNNWHFDPRYGKDDHRAWAEHLRERVRADDALILNSPHTEELFRYYADDIVPVTTLPILRADGIASPEKDLAAVRETYRRYARVWYLSMHAPFDDPQGRIEKMLNDEGILLDQSDFRGASTRLALSLFVRALPTANASDIAHPMNALFDARLRLLGYDAPASIAAGARGVVNLYWMLDEPAGEDYGVSLRVVDDAGNRWGQWDAIPLGNRMGTLTWETKKIIVGAHDLPVNAGAPPGRYHLQMQVYHGATGNGIGDAVMLGDIDVVTK
jgi:4-amino-4-deoxy-L-arabinose transferase-like glycosyltransferase